MFPRDRITHLQQSHQHEMLTISTVIRYTCDEVNLCSEMEHTNDQDPMTTHIVAHVFTLSILGHVTDSAHIHCTHVQLFVQLERIRHMLKRHIGEHSLGEAVSCSLEGIAHAPRLGQTPSGPGIQAKFEVQQGPEARK